MCRRTEEEVGPTVGLPCNIHFVGFFQVQVNRTLQRMVDHVTEPCQLCCCCDTSYIVSVYIQCQASILYTFSVSRVFMAGAANQAGDADSSRALGLASGLQGVRECPPWCSIVGTTVTVHQFFCILHWYIPQEHVKTNHPILSNSHPSENNS